jgi:D-amino-acid dehydrogenase
VKVAVVGGGVVGLCTAWSLANAGADVLVLDRSRCGSGASHGNSGWISPGGASRPLPTPGLIGRIVKWELRRRGPVIVRPRLDLGFLRWAWSFSRHCSPARQRESLRSMVALNARTLDLLDAYEAAGVEFETYRDGLLAVAMSQRALDEDARAYEDIAAAGYVTRIERLDHRAVRLFEPALSENVAGGLDVVTDRHLRPESLTGGLAAYLREHGAEVLEEAEVIRVSRNGGWKLQTPDRVHRADKVVIAAGIWSRDLLAPLGIRILLQGAKGYSITAKGTGTRPAHPLHFIDARIGCSPFRDAVRLVGLFEMPARDQSTTRRRIDRIVRSARPYLESWTPGAPALDWAGVRPFCADGRPAIGEVRGHDGLFLATGHGMAGMTMAPATGDLLASLIVEGKLPSALEPFTVARLQ